jgi:holo-[acyl-carrier protein] synthase
MSKNIGIDIVEFEEIRERLSERFVNRILSDQELVRYHQMKKTDQKIAYLAGRFAAKEAYTKVYKKFEEPLNFKDVIILNDPYGAPYIISKYRPTDRVSVSISHSRNYAVAVCIKE